MRISLPRTSEYEISVVVLHIASERPDGYVTLNELREIVPNRIDLTKGDMKPSLTRPKERLWEQQLRNIRSHKDTATNFIFLGYLEHYPGGGYRITDAGREFLRSLE